MRGTTLAAFWIFARAGGFAMNAVSAKRRGGRRLTRIGPKISGSVIRYFC